MVQRCRYCLLLLLIAISVVSASLPHNNYLHLVEKHRRLTDSQLPRAKSVCGGASLINSSVWAAVVKFCAPARLHVAACKAHNQHVTYAMQTRTLVIP